jgi:hypothetical protein
VVVSKVRIHPHSDFSPPNNHSQYIEIEYTDLIPDIHQPYVPSDTPIDKAKFWLAIIQNYEPDVLPRTKELGTQNHFEDILESSKRTIKLFNRIDINNLDIYSKSQLNLIWQNSKNIISNFYKVVKFNVQNPSSLTRDQLIDHILTLNDNIIDQLSPIISFSMSLSGGLSSDERKVDQVIKRYEAEREIEQNEISSQKFEVAEILKQVRESSVTLGVSKESHNFDIIAKKYETDSKKWLNRSVFMGMITLLFAIISSLSYKIPCIAPNTNIESAQLISGKIIILGILSYGLLTCIRNYTAQLHNSVVNRHRQNSLQTYRSFVDAASNNVTRDIVLTHAAAAVFSPQDTGYVKNQDTSSARSIIEMIPKSIMGDTKPG